MRTWFFILFGIVAVLVAGLIATIIVSAPQKEPEQEPTARGFSTLSGPLNTFTSLQTQENFQQKSAALLQEPYVIPSEEEQQVLIDRLIRAWEARSGGDTTQAYSAVRSDTGAEGAAGTSGSEDISTMFNSLLGPKLVDRQGIPSGSGSAGSYQPYGNEIFWSGQYNDTQAPAPESDAETPLQEELHAYGNELGAKLRSFLSAEGDQAALLDRFVKDRSEISELLALTNAYAELSATLAKIKAPVPLANTHAGLVSSYAEVGEYLWDLTNAKDDFVLLDKMLAYNKKSEAVAKHHVTIITIFKAHGVEFASGEPGSVFGFSPPY
ncbi:MAG: hypothetical protein Q8P16_02320 [bacterium]|nr:hypothetical protein [bacterium]